MFVPNSANLLDEAFGLATFNFPMLPSVSKPRIESAIIKGIPDKNGKKNRRGRAIAWSLSAVAVIAGLVCMSLYMGWFDRLFGNGDDNTMLAGFGVSANNEQVVEAAEEAIADEQTADFAEAQEVVAEETESQDLASEEVLADEEITTEEPVATSVETPVVAVNTTEYKVHIIAGCFANYENAENVYKDLSSRGLSPQILPLNKGLYKVSVKGFATTADACAELQGLKELTGNDSLWVMKM